MMELINKAERAAAQLRAMLVRQPAAVAPLDQHGAAIGPFEQPGDVQQRGFSGARRADQRDNLAGKQREVHAVQHRQRDAAAGLFAGQFGCAPPLQLRAPSPSRIARRRGRQSRTVSRCSMDLGQPG